MILQYFFFSDPYVGFSRESRKERMREKWRGEEGQLLLSSQLADVRWRGISNESTTSHVRQVSTGQADSHWNIQCSHIIHLTPLSLKQAWKEEEELCRIMRDNRSVQNHIYCWIIFKYGVLSNFFGKMILMHVEDVWNVVKMGYVYSYTVALYTIQVHCKKYCWFN